MSRRFDPGYDHAAVARWLRQNAMKGFNRGLDDHSMRYMDGCSCGVNLEFPNSVSLIFTRDMIPPEPNAWHLSVCCVTPKGYREYVPEEGEHWVELMFGHYRGRAILRPLEERSPMGVQKDVRHWRLDCDWTDRADPAVTLEGLDL